MADDPIGTLAAVVAVVTLPLGTLSLFFVGWEVAMVVFVVGWFLLAPLIPIVGEELLPALGSAESEGKTSDPLTELRGRYARGEIGDEEFERRVERLVATERIDLNRDAAFDRSSSADADPQRDVERSR
ncbi:MULTISPECIES: SHOCT domain-containing protein [Halorussus]|uniref:SHOCT domain-containing protein n=1 Tax=Halorussus TaxID=1070314 RepID=UPI000E21828E|nr:MULTISPECIES: SHOCT domain-containing protein [Halorussus]NHN57770.1 SHOCT domain-containing protein [Halorussus sp. JP-T4]